MVVFSIYRTSFEIRSCILHGNMILAHRSTQLIYGKHKFVLYRKIRFVATCAGCSLGRFSDIWLLGGLKYENYWMWTFSEGTYFVMHSKKGTICSKYEDYKWKPTSAVLYALHLYNSNYCSQRRLRMRANSTVV